MASIKTLPKNLSTLSARSDSVFERSRALKRKRGQSEQTALQYHLLSPDLFKVYSGQRYVSSVPPRKKWVKPSDNTFFPSQYFRPPLSASSPSSFTYSHPTNRPDTPYPSTDATPEADQTMSDDTTGEEEYPDTWSSII